MKRNMLVLALALMSLVGVATANWKQALYDVRPNARLITTALAVEALVRGNQSTLPRFYRYVKANWQAWREEAAEAAENIDAALSADEDTESADANAKLSASNS